MAFVLYYSPLQSAIFACMYFAIKLTIFWLHFFKHVIFTGITTRGAPDPEFLDPAGSGSTPDPEMLDPAGSGTRPDPNALDPDPA